MIFQERNDAVVLKGIGASPGVAIGPAFVFDHKKGKVVRYRIQEEDVAFERERFAKAVQGAEEQILRLLQEIPDELKEHTHILRSHQLMLRDKMVYDQTMALIADDKINAEWALGRSLEHLRELFDQIKEPYIRERIGDIEYVIQRVQGVLAGAPAIDGAYSNEPVILVARDLSPADTVQLDPEKILAFVTDMGSRTSHTAIVARSLGIPALVGVEKATSRIMSGETVVVDGFRGEIIVAPNEEQLRLYNEKLESYRRYRLDIIHHSHFPAETSDGFRIKVKANIELLEEIPSVISHGAEGVGLLRTEFLYLAKRELPSEETLFTTYKEIVERLAPYPVTIRTLDIGGDKFVSSVSLGEEINPALGLRAVRLCLKEPGLFRTQLRSILRASVYGDVRILVPLISGLREIIEVKARIAEIKEELLRDGLPFDENIKVGIMIEVPTAVMIADILAKEVDFFSIGTNDLIQYSLAIDRVNESVAHLYEPLHPGILRMLQRASEAAHSAGIEVAICGEMAGELAYAPILIGMGFDELSMNAHVIPRIKRVVRQLTYEECRNLVRDLSACSTAGEVRTKVTHFLTAHFPDEFDSGRGLYGDFTKQEASPTEL